MLLYIFIFVELCIFWGQARIPYLSSILNNLSSTIGSNIYSLENLGVPAWVLDTLNNASSSVIMQLIPVVILFLCFGYGFRKMGFEFSNLPLIITLLGTTIILGLPFKILFQQPIHRTIITYFIMMFVNGLPEELIFRGYLLPRLESVLKNPINAMVIVSILFNIMHIPSELARGISIYHALLMSFSIVYPSGLIWGYLYLKTRSIVPGVIWHTSNTILGIIFIGV